MPPGVPGAFTEPVDDPLADLVGRHARTHGPFTVADVSHRLGLGAAVVRQTLHRLAAEGRVLEGEFVPGTAVGITVEPAGGSEQPTTEPIAVIAT